MSEWQTIDTAPLDVEILTKIDDHDGVRNVGTLVQRRNDGAARSLWWFPDGSMYVYYVPTHWRFVDGAE